MSAPATILVATDSTNEAELVVNLLRSEFGTVVASTDPERAVKDFEQHKPAVLVLAFDTVEKCERYYLGLYRLSKLVHALPHRTLILCNKEEVRRVYELCKKEYFDDYVLFWPATNDAPRLAMAVHQALRQLAAALPGAREIAAQARHLDGLESVLDQHAAKGERQMNIASQSLAQTEQDIGAALDRISHKLSEGGRPDLVEIKDRAGLQQEFNRLKTEEIGKHLDSIASSLRPMRQWTSALKQDLAPQLKSARVLKSMAEQVRPLILAVDDDEFQLKLLTRLLAEANLEQVIAASGTEALASLRKRRPDLIFMDVELPDIDGIEVVRRIKSIEKFAVIPIIMITGHSENDIVVQSLKAGAVDFVVKPFDKQILLAKVRKHLGLGTSA